MGISLDHAELSLEDRFAIIHARVQREIRNPRVLQKEELFAMVIEAARQIDIPDVAVYRWNPDFMVNFPTCGGLREKKYSAKRREKNTRIDLGYFKLTGGKYSVRSFLVNPWTFSDERANRFFDALRKQNLEPSFHRLGWTVYGPDEDAEKAWQNRRILYQ